MKTFSELKLIGSSSNLEKLIEQVEQNICDGWARDKDEECRQRISSKVDYQIFVCSKTSLRRAAALFFTFHSNKYLYLCNIVPREKGTENLEIDNYNSILEEFQTKFLEPCAQGLDIRIVVTPSEINATNSMSPELATKFQQFSYAANKSSGGTHPYDEERLFDFVIQAHLEKSLLDESTLRKLLVDEGWSDKDAYELSVKYDFGKDLLKRYESSTNS
jgi:hypothetical protein